MNTTYIVNHGDNLLRFAARKGLSSVAKDLLNQGVPVEATDRLGNSALHYAALEGHAETLKVLIDHCDQINPSLIDSKNLEGKTARALSSTQKTNAIFTLYYSNKEKIKDTTVEIKNKRYLLYVQSAQKFYQVEEYKEELAKKVDGVCFLLIAALDIKSSSYIDLYNILTDNINSISSDNEVRRKLNTYVSGLLFYS